VNAIFGGTAFDGRVAILRAIADEDVAGALVALGELLDAGHEPRRLTEDLLATVRDAFLLTSARGRVRVDAPDDALAALETLGEQLGAAPLVRVMETLGQAIVDMRGTDAADPRLVLEIALVRLARRDAGPPLQALAERVDRLERSGVVATPTSEPSVRPPVPSRSAEPSTPARSGRSFKELKQERGAAPAAPSSAPEVAAATSSAAAAEDEGLAPEPPSAPAGDVDIDDVILAWAEILPDLPPATRAAVREAQPLAVDDGVITFGVPKAHYDVALPRFKKEADNIRAALSQKLGRRMMFKPVPHDGFGAEPAPSAAVPLDEEPPDDDEIDLADLVDDAAAPAADSVTLITQSLGATVVEEVPRD
jgi:DNA polymerase-3 subunit gamma/tau